MEESGFEKLGSIKRDWFINYGGWGGGRSLT